MTPHSTAQIPLNILLLVHRHFEHLSVQTFAKRHMLLRFQGLNPYLFSDVPHLSRGPAFLGFIEQHQNPQTKWLPQISHSLLLVLPLGKMLGKIRICCRQTIVSVPSYQWPLPTWQQEDLHSQRLLQPQLGKNF